LDDVLSNSTVGGILDDVVALFKLHKIAKHSVRSAWIDSQCRSLQNSQRRQAWNLDNMVCFHNRMRSPRSEAWHHWQHPVAALQSKALISGRTNIHHLGQAFVARRGAVLGLLWF